MAKRGGKISPATEFKKGVSGNPKGRPPVLRPLKEVIEKILNEEQNGITALEAVIIALHRRAVKGDTAAIRELLDRYYGKPKQEMDVTSNGQNIIMPIIKIERDDE